MEKKNDFFHPPLAHAFFLRFFFSVANFPRFFEKKEFCF